MEGNFTKPLLGIGSLVFKLVGQAIILVAGVYLLNIVAQTGKYTIEAMPRIVDRIGENGNDISAAENWKAGLEYCQIYGWKFIKVSFIIVFGLIIKNIGLWLENS